MKEYKPVKIFCPQCKGRVGTYDGRSTTNFVSRCRKCNKRIVYYVDTKEIKIKPLPHRASSGGLSFC